MMEHYLVNWCCMCREDEETIDHLFLHCKVANELWDLVLSLFGMHWVMPRRVVDLLACWQGGLGWVGIETLRFGRLFLIV